MPRFHPSHRNPEALQSEICEYCGAIRPRDRLVELQVEGMRGVMACDTCCRGLKGLSFRDFKALQGTKPQQLPTRLEPYGAADLWFETEEMQEE